MLGKVGIENLEDGFAIRRGKLLQLLETAPQPEIGDGRWLGAQALHTEDLLHGGAERLGEGRNRIGGGRTARVS